jgi:cell division septal protein FtsQ
VSVNYESSQRFLRPHDVGRVRRNQRRIQVQRLLGVLGHIAVVATVLAIAAWLYLRAQSDVRFALKTIDVTGAVQTPRAAIDEVTKSYAGTNLFRLDITRLQESLQRLPWVSRVEIEKNLPDTLHIRVVERVPVALLHTDDAQANGNVRPSSFEQRTANSEQRSAPSGQGTSLQYVDERGVAFAQLSPTVGDRDLPVIRDASGAELARAVTLLRTLRAGDPQLFSRISEVRPVAPRGFVLFDRELGAQVFANEDDLSAKWRDFYAVVHAENLGPHSIEYADLRFGGRIVIKPVHSIATTAAPAPIAAPAQITN